ncbi:MAG: tetratricopeptide repeat protein, partial [Bryobacteraceae bacterium]
MSDTVYSVRATARREAIAAYQRARAIEPDLPGLNLNLGLAWFKLGNFSEALAAFQKESARAPSERLTTLIAMSYFGLARYREAAARL